MYQLTAFSADGTYLDIPERMPEHDLSTGNYANPSFDLSTGGAFDGLGSEESAPRAYPLRKKMRIWYSTQAERLSFFRSLRGMVGKKGRLYRKWEDDESEWVTARFIGIDSQRELEDRFSLEVTMKWKIYSYYWHGEYIGSWTLDSGEFLDTGLQLDSSPETYTLDASPKNITVTPTGNAIINDSIITVTAGSADITALEIKNTLSGHEAELDYSGTITASEALVIDCGAHSVENDGSDDDANFSLGATHAINEWFRLSPEANTITVTITGGSTDSTIGFTYYQAAK